MYFLSFHIWIQISHWPWVNYLNSALNNPAKGYNSLTFFRNFMFTCECAPLVFVSMQAVPFKNSQILKGIMHLNHCKPRGGRSSKQRLGIWSKRKYVSNFNQYYIDLLTCMFQLTHFRPHDLNPRNCFFEMLSYIYVPASKCTCMSGYKFVKRQKANSMENITLL